MIGAVELKSLDGCEVTPGVWLIGEPTPIPGTDKVVAALTTLRANLKTPNVRANLTKGAADEA